jgi:uncharacterized protein YkwD
MRIRGILILLVVVAAAAALASGASARRSVVYHASDEERVASLINGIRRRHQLMPLVFSGALRSAAREHSSDMLARQYFEHDSPTETFDSRIRRYLSAPLVAEDIGWGTGQYATPEGMVSLWMHSAPHRKVLLLPELRRFGLGITVGRFEGSDSAAVVTADFAS